MQSLGGESFHLADGRGPDDDDPLLPVGFHRADLGQVKRLCVDYFPESTLRSQIMETVTRIVELLNRAGFPATLWIDGAFVTEKENPTSFDATLVLTQQVYERLNKAQRELVHWFRTAQLAGENRCNNYTVIIDADRRDGEIMHRYWLRQYGFDRARQGGGGIEILLPSIVP